MAHAPSGLSANRLNDIERRARWLCAASLTAALGFFATSAGATPNDQGEQAEPVAVTADDVRQYVNLRGGASSSNLNGRPEVCMEGTPIPSLSLESCGTGNGIWHSSTGTELAHVRLKWHLTSFTSGSLVFQPGVGAGLAELQVAADEPGLKFSDPGARGAETAGPEAALFLRALYPLPHSFEFVADLQAGTAYFQSGPRLSEPVSQWHPFVTLSVGIGY